MFMTLSPEEYKLAIQTLNRYSKHTDLVSDTIKKQVLPKLGNKSNLLDVGSGPGIITDKLDSFFEQVTIIEPNNEMASFYQNKPYNKHFQDFLSWDKDKDYDLIVCSHVLYHMNKDYMKQFLLKLADCKNNNGCCMVGLMAPRGQNHELHEEFNKNYINSNLIMEILSDEKIPFEKVEARNSFDVNEYEEMLALLRFFALEDCITKDELASYSEKQREELDQHLREQAESLKQGNRYSLEQQEDYILIFH